MKQSDRKCLLPTENKKMKLLQRYSKSGCEYECAIGKAALDCGCFPWNIPKMFYSSNSSYSSHSSNSSNPSYSSNTSHSSNPPNSSNTSYTSKMSKTPKTCDLLGNLCFFNTYNLPSTYFNCNCPSDCQTTSFAVSESSRPILEFEELCNSGTIQIIRDT
jgi:hypothetical protein